MSMNCEKCGAPLEEGTKFCPSCGAEVVAAAETVTEPVEAAEQSAYTEPEQPTYETAPVNQNAANTYGEEAPQTGKGFAIASMVCGIASIVFCCFGYFGLILGIAGVVLGIISKKKTTEGSGMALAGIITGAVGGVLALGMVIFSAVTSAAFSGMTPEQITDYFSNM